MQNHTNALLLAIAKEGQEKVVDAFLDREPELDLQDSVCLNLLELYGTLQLVLCLSQYGETALIFACKLRNLRFVKRLLSMGANPNIANNVSSLTII